MSDTVKRTVSLLDENGKHVASGVLYVDVPEELTARKRDNYIQKVYDNLARDGYTVITPIGAFETPYSPEHNGVRLP